ncbi:hypothetical protein BKA65DRAFT_476749 [Rhexocercosporidium sp. MPI-PUGE-AT-0058]|nr:hypothetical protein BKA65DRAFT_476749 [Rhexocercosporidium sp. MPI-PUGE-AT-0058]
MAATSLHTNSSTMDSTAISINAFAAPFPQQRHEAIRHVEASASLSVIPLLQHNEDRYNFAELPELFRTLIVQASNKLNTFTCFPNLPKKIRLVIWCLTFPRGRRVNLDYWVGYSFRSTCSKLDRKRTFWIETHCAHPTTLYINQESRQETLRRYYVLLRPDSPYEPYSAVRPICYNPAIDFGFNTTTEIDSLYRLGLQTILKDNDSTFFSSIQELEIRDWQFTAQENEALRSATHKSKLPKSCVCSVFFNFPRLRRLKMSKDPDNGHPLILNQGVEKLMKDWDEFLKKFTPKGREPFEVSVEP